MAIDRGPMVNTHRFTQRLRIAYALCIAAPLFAAFWLWSFSYFWTDDFGNIFWSESATAPVLLWHVINPLSTFYRPFGLLVYRVMYHTFDFNPLPYHLLGWTLHAANTVLVLILLRRLLHSRFAAAAGTVPFAFRVNFADIYWSFGTIFELLACGLMLLGLYLYIRYRPSVPVMIGLTFIYIVAVRSKEMAITLPLLWLLYDVWIRGRIRLDTLTVPVIAAAWLAYWRATTMRSIDPHDPYYIDLHARTLVGGFGQYFNWLYGIKLPPLLWCALIVAALGVFFYLRERRALFFLSYTIVTFAPVIFLVNHRWPYFWYIPFFGIAGLFGLAAQRLTGWVVRSMPKERWIAANMIVLALWSAGSITLEYWRSVRTRAYEAEMAEQFRSYVSGLRALKKPEPGATLYFNEMPPHFHPEVLNSSVQVILHRPDIHAQFVSTFPPDTR